MHQALEMKGTGKCMRQMPIVPATVYNMHLLLLLLLLLFPGWHQQLAERSHVDSDLHVCGSRVLGAQGPNVEQLR
jgi:hypothetical protein